MDEFQKSAVIFSQQFNAITGRMEWESMDENYDYHQEVARSGYADMLHDSERNQKYYKGLKAAFAQLRAKGSDIRVLDIGTGTGLLSMMAIELGADDVTACEAFMPMANCAKEVLTFNGYANKVRLIPKRSTELTVGPDGDMPCRANVLVTEVFDTELIGEGAIGTFNHAHVHLLEDVCFVVPSRAVIYIQLVQSDLLHRWHRPLKIEMEDTCPIVPPDDVADCAGAANVLDLQMSQLPTDQLHFLTNAESINRLDFSSKKTISEQDICLKNITATGAGECHAVLFWWDLDMDPEGKVVLSCAPSWAHPDGTSQPWREHWMQAVYFPLSTTQCRKDDVVTVSCSHDEYSFWFDVTSSATSEKSVEASRMLRPQCTCGIHSICNYSRLGMLNDPERNRKYESVLRKIIESGAVCLYIGETSMLPLMAVRLGASKVYVIDDHSHSARMLRSYVLKNSMEEKIIIIEKKANDVSLADISNDSIDVVLGEPYFTSSLLPWHSLHYWYAVSKTRNLCNPKTKIAPISGELWAVAVHFNELWKIRAPLGSVENFCMEPFDKLIQGSIDVADALIEPQSLWEYKSRALSNPFRLLSIEIVQEHAENVTGEDSIPLLSLDGCNGIALWMEWHLSKETVVCQGPLSPVLPGDWIQWDPNSKQGVHFITKDVPPQNAIPQSLNYSAVFEILTGNVKLEFALK